MDSAEFLQLVPVRIETSKAHLEAFLGLPDDVPIETVLDAFDAIRHPLNEVSGWVELFSAVHPDAQVRDAADRFERDLARWQTELSMHRGAWEKLARFSTDDAPDADARRFLDRAQRDFRRSGVDRDEAQREELKRLSEELVEVGQAFDRNIIEDTREIVIEDGAAGLRGLPEDFVRAHPEDERGHVRVSTDPQDWLPFITFAERDDLRERLYRERMNRAHPSNLEQLDALLEKRYRFARALSYENYAAYVTEELMTRDERTVGDFIRRCAELARPRMEREREELLALKRELMEPDATEVHDWQKSYLVEKVKARRFGFNAQEARAYFAYERVRQGILDVSAKLYGVDFRRNEDVPLWHESVECWDVLEAGERIARFYLDMHPRAGKYKHAAMFGLVTGFGDEVLPAACLVCNFGAPTADDPALMLHDQVTTYFHEFGHLLHHLFSRRQRYLYFAGLSTEWDFVEVPSQMYEEWAWDADVLADFAVHHETGEPIPRDLVDRMRAAEEYGKATDVCTQMFYAALSLSLYDADPSTFDTTQRMIELRAEFAPFRHVDGTNFHTSFGHLNGYSAIYYTYMWSLVIAKDLFSRFREDPMSPDAARDYRERVISQGGSRDASELCAAFLGREYSFEAWENWLAS